MLYTNISLKNVHYTLRSLAAQDSMLLARYFAELSEETKTRFQPHPLTAEKARDITRNPHESTFRLVLFHGTRICGYFILEAEMSIHEKTRYAEHGIELESGLDVLFAPSILDEYQNTGLASSVMPHLLDLARRINARSLVLMGGTQETNARAIAFYEKFGFKRFGGYSTEMFNHDMRLVL